MEGLVLDSIPHHLLARIILQLYVVPVSALQQKQINLMTILLAGLQHFGQTSDLEGLFAFCLQATKEYFANQDGDPFGLNEWSWKQRDLATLEDWDLLNAATPDNREPVALHIQITAEEVRSSLGLVKFGREASKARDPRINYQYNGNPIPISSILQGTLSYLESRKTVQQSLAKINDTINNVLNHVEKYRIEQEQRQDLQSDIDYILMGALMVHRDGISTAGYGKQMWYLYLRDYISDGAGTLWRVIAEEDSVDEPQVRISSSQALADIRGCPVPLDDEGVLQPSPASKNYRPVYLFYCNEKMMANVPNPEGPAEEEKNKGSIPSGGENMITLEDYTFDEEYMYEDPEMEDASCKHCGIPDIAEDINNMFFCDECHMGVHQLCEDPPIASYEQEIDPWYCRDCSRRKGMPIPPKRPAQDTSTEHWKEPKKRKELSD